MTDAAKRALVIGASGGVGSALAAELESNGWSVDRLSRRDDRLDIADEVSVGARLGAIDAEFDLVFVATGVLASKGEPEKSLKALSSGALAAQFAVNAIGPALVLKHSVRLLPRKRRAVFAALSARVGSIGDNSLGGWYSYRASKAALNQLIRTASIELRRTHKQSICVALHPGTVATEFTRNYRNHDSVPPATAAKNLLNVLDRLTPDDTGRFFDWAGDKVPW